MNELSQHLFDILEDMRQAGLEKQAMHIAAIIISACREGRGEHNKDYLVGVTKWLAMEREDG